MTADGGTSLSTLDTKKKSASEALVNALGGYPIGYGLGIIILPLCSGWIQEDRTWQTLQSLAHMPSLPLLGRIS